MSTASLHSQFAYKELLQERVTKGSRWLDVGCGRSLIPDWVANSVAIQKELIDRCEIAVGWDPYDPRRHCAGLTKYVCDYSMLPFPKGFFDIITGNMVAEHVERPEMFLKQLHFLLRPGGFLILHTPNRFYPPILVASLLPKPLVRHIASFLDGRSHADIFPTFYRLNTPRAFSRAKEFRLLEARCVPTSPVLNKIPVLGWLEGRLVKYRSRALLKNLQADWLVVLQSLPDQTVANLKHAA